MEATQHFFSFSPAIGLVGFIFALMTYAWVVKQPAGNAKMTHIATLIENGSMTFLKNIHKKRRIRPTPNKILNLTVSILEN